MDKYLIWYYLSEDRKVKFAAMKLTGQASQYCINEIDESISISGSYKDLVYYEGQI